MYVVEEASEEYLGLVDVMQRTACAIEVQPRAVRSVIMASKKSIDPGVHYLQMQGYAGQLAPTCSGPVVYRSES